MKPFFLLAGVLLATLLGGCHSDTIRGAYVFGHERETITLCSDGQTYWLKADMDVKNTLRQAHKRMTTMPYQAIFVELDGHIADQPASGFASDYSGYFVATKVHDISYFRPESCPIPK